uniref:Uncharacterized protein n=1 Tax=Sus scrofa TaxID=9823 RepID=A0A8W4F9Y5_PIG
MSSPDEVSVWGAGFGPEGGEPAGVRPAGPGAQRGPGPGPDAGPPQSGEGEGGGGFRDPKGFESETEELEAGGLVLWGREGRPGSPADDKGVALDLANESAAAILRQLADLDVLGVRRSPSPESCAPAAAAEVSAVWAGLEAGAGSGGASAQGCGEAQQALARCLHLGGPEAGWAWPNRKRGTKSRLPLAASRQRPPAEGRVGLPSDPESSDEFGEIQLMRVSIYPRGGGQAQPCSPEAPGFTLPHFQVRENFLHVPGAFLAPALRGFTSVVERQGVGEPDISSPKKMQSILWGKEGSRPTAAAAAAAGGLPRATPRKKGAQEKKPLGGASALALGRTFPPWGQRVSAAPLEPATFPPIAGVPLLGRSRKYSLVPSGTKQSKHAGAGKKPAARRARESELVVAGEDNDPDGDQVARGQLPTHRPGPSCPYLHHGYPSSGDLSTRAPHVAGDSEPSALNQVAVMARGPAPSGDLETLDHPPRRERQQQPPGAQGCPRRLLMPLPIAAAMRYLADMFQTL